MVVVRRRAIRVMVVMNGKQSVMHGYMIGPVIRGIFCRGQRVLRNLTLVPRGII